MVERTGPERPAAHHDRSADKVDEYREAEDYPDEAS